MIEGRSTRCHDSSTIPGDGQPEWTAYGRNGVDPAEVPEDEPLSRLLALHLDRAGSNEKCNR